MLEIWVDLQEEYSTLVCSWCTFDLRRKAREGQYSFVEQDIKQCDELEYLTWVGQTKAHVKKEKGLVALKVSSLSQEVQIIIMNKKTLSDHCQYVH